MATKKGHVNIYGYRGSICPFCGCIIALRDFYSEHCAGIPIAKAFRDTLSWDEYTVTGLCQSCQDAMYGIED